MSDLSLIYEQYRKIIKEATPFAAPEEGFGQPTQITRHRPILKGVTQPSGYRLGKYAQEQNRDVVEVTREIINKIKTEVFTPQNTNIGGIEYQHYFPGDIAELRTRVAIIILRDLRGGAAEANHTARIIVNHILKLADIDQNGRIVTTELAEVGAEPQVQHAIEQAVERAPRAPRQAAEPAAPDEQPMAGIQLTSKYKLTEGRTRNPEVREMYNYLVRELGLDQETTGHELVTKLRAQNNSYSVSKSYLAEMIADGLLEKVQDEEAAAVPDIGEEPEYDPEEVNRILTDLRRNVAGGRTEIPGVEE